MNNLHVILEIELSYPHKKSSQTLIEFTNTWGFRLISVSTKKNVAIISMDWKKFKKIWGYNPKVGFQEIPDGLDHFIAGVNVLFIKDIG